MDYRSIFLSASYGRKVASTRWRSAPRALKALRNSCRRTADWRGLSNPFDVSAALKASASYLRDLRARFGNLGLAAAAYNAGPQRVQDWLSARGGLPKETRHYVQIVTGHSAEEWTGGTTRANLELPEPMPCRDVAKVWFSNGGEVGRWYREGTRKQLLPKPNPAGAFNLSAVPPKPRHWRHFNNCRRRIRIFRWHVSRSLSNPKSERAVPGIVCVSLPTVAARPRSCALASGRRAAAAWCSAIEVALLPSSTCDIC